MYSQSHACNCAKKERVFSHSGKSYYKFMLRHTSISVCSGLSLFLRSETTYPERENTLSLGTDVAGVARVALAICETCGNLDALLAHH